LYTLLKATLARVPKVGLGAGHRLWRSERWIALVRHCNDGAIEMDNNAAERAATFIRAGQEEYLYRSFGSGLRACWRQS